MSYRIPIIKLGPLKITAFDDANWEYSSSYLSYLAEEKTNSRPKCFHFDSCFDHLSLFPKTNFHLKNLKNYALSAKPFEVSYRLSSYDIKLHLFQNMRDAF